MADRGKAFIWIKNIKSLYLLHSEIEYTPSSIINTDRRNISLYACIMALYAAEDDGRIMVIPSLSNNSDISGNRNVEQNQTLRELAHWDAAVSQLLGQGYIKSVGKKDLIYRLSEDGFNLAERFKRTMQCCSDKKR